MKWSWLHEFAGLFFQLPVFSRRIKANRLVITIFTFTKSNILCVLDNTTLETRYLLFFGIVNLSRVVINYCFLSAVAVISIFLISCSNSGLTSYVYLTTINTNCQPNHIQRLCACKALYKSPSNKYHWLSKL